MDTLTHGLLGAAVAALPLPRWLSRRWGSEPLRGAILVSVLAAELPDLDYLLPASDAVLHALSAHRGYTHALLAAPAIGLLAAVLTKAVYRAAPFGPLAVRGMLSVPLAHLLPDLWTGWGTRLLLPFSERRFALDWTMVIDPLFTLPLLAAAVWSVARRRDFRRAFAIAAAVASAYLMLRIGLSSHLTDQVERAYPQADSVDVFPTLLAVTRWRYVARVGAEYAAGTVAVGTPPKQATRLALLPSGPLSADLAAVPTVREILAWARFPVVRVTPLGGSRQRVEIADLRYHLGGVPTLNFVLEIGPDSSVDNARLDRGGSARELWRRVRTDAD